MTSATMTLIAVSKNSRSPDETRNFPNGKVEVFHLRDRDTAIVTLQPGWKYSTDVGPMENQAHCRGEHLQYVLSGRLMVEMQDGTKMELSPGDFASIPPGHDAWVMGNEPYVAVDLLGMKEYSKPREEPTYMPEYDEIVGFD